MKPRVGVGITTRNRHRFYYRTLAQVKAFTPEGSVVVTVDDASEFPVPNADYRFEEQAGVARAKNKCLALLMDSGCDELFLLDDDTHPLRDDWTDLYIGNPEPHLCYLFLSHGQQWPKLTYRDGVTFAHSHPRGCMMYLNRRVVEECGGYRPEFGIWGNEHVEYSLRIHRTGLTRNAYQDAMGSHRYIYSMDEHWNYHRFDGFESCVPMSDRLDWLARNDKLLAELQDTTKGFVPYREG